MNFINEELIWKKQIFNNSQKSSFSLCIQISLNETAVVFFSFLTRLRNNKKTAN